MSIVRTTFATAAALAIFGGLMVAQENKPVPKDSVRVSIPGCARGYIFTAGRRTIDQPGTLQIPDGMHLRMNGPKKMMAEIKAHEGSMIEIIGLMKRGQPQPAGVAVGGGLRVTPGEPPTPAGGQSLVDVESWRPILGGCRSQ